MSWRRTWSSNTNKLQIQYHPTRSTYHKAALVEKKINSIAGMAVLGASRSLSEQVHRKTGSCTKHAWDFQVPTFFSRVDPGAGRWPKQHHNENFHLSIRPRPPRWHRGAGRRTTAITLSSSETLSPASIPHAVFEFVCLSRCAMMSRPIYSRLCSNPTM